MQYLNETGTACQPDHGGPDHGGPARTATLVRHDRAAPVRVTTGASRALGARGPAGRALPGPARAPGTSMTVAVMATDPLTAEGAVAYLRAQPGVTPLGAASQATADVVLILAGQITEETLQIMQQAAELAGDRELRFVVVGDGVREPQLLRAVSLGQVSILPRQGTGYEHILRAIRGLGEGRVQLPEVALGWLAGQLRTIQREVLAPNGLTAAGLESREVDVLRLLADGMDTAEIAEQLNYSQRTVKNIIHGLLSRLKLRNRPHAVAYALRHGVL